MLNRKDVADMENVLNAAFYIYYMYLQKTGQILDKMKLHKLLYFSQRESLVRNDQPLFMDNFQGWKYGPVCVPIRKLYRKGKFQNKNESLKYIEKLSKESRNIIDYVLEVYGKKESWSLSDITHTEYSWRQSRIGIPEGENGEKVILLDDILIDAKRIQNRREKLKAAQKNSLPLNTAFYVPIIQEDDLSFQKEKLIIVADKIDEIYAKLEKLAIRRRKDKNLVPLINFYKKDLHCPSCCVTLDLL